MSTSLPVQLDLPCQVPWDQMAGDERVRFCTQCNLNVHNLSAMTEDEAAVFLAMRGGRVCVAYERRADGGAVFAGARSLPVIQYATPTRRRRWLVPAAIAGAIATAGAAAALKPTATKVATAAGGGGGTGVMVPGGIAPPPLTAFDPRNPPVKCGVLGTPNIASVIQYDDVAKALVAALPEGLELTDARYSVYPAGANPQHGFSYVVSVAPGYAPDAGQLHAVLWLLPTGTDAFCTDGSGGPSRIPTTWHGGRYDLFIDTDDGELARYLAHALAGPLPPGAV